MFGCLLAAACTGDASLTGGSDAGSAQAQRCAPDNTYAQDAQGNLLSDYSSGTRALEKQWLLAYFQQNYLWYSEIPTVDPGAAAYNTGTHFQLMEAYFKALRTKATDASGVAKDRFSFVYPTAAYDQRSQAGVTLGYGVEWKVTDATGTTPRIIEVAVVQPGSQAEQVGLARGDKLVSATVNGSTAAAEATTAADVALLNAAVYPSTRGQAITLQVRAFAGQAKSATVTATDITAPPVFASRVVSVGSRRVGYMNLMAFNAPAESQMIAVFNQFRSQNVQDLVIDLRYNGGGYLYLSSQLAYMIAGANPTQGRVFERLEYNAKRSSSNVDTPFYATTTGYSGSGTTRGTSLPTLNLSRVTVLATDDTCSASESLINGLRGVGITVDLVGSKTCGKPYGFTQKDNCGLSYFPIEFQGVNAKGEGDFASGMLPNCAANDDLGKALGDVNEGLFAAALAYRASGVCPALKSTSQAGADQGRLLRLPGQVGIFLRPEESQ